MSLFENGTIGRTIPEVCVNQGAGSEHIVHKVDTVLYFHCCTKRYRQGSTHPTPCVVIC